MAEESEQDNPLNREIFTSHNTPPPILFMEGSCIIEVPNWDPATQSLDDILVETETAGLPENTRTQLLTSVDEQFLAHIKVVDGSGEMLFRFDNDGHPPHSLTVNLRLEKDHVWVGNFILIAANGEFRVALPMDYKIDAKPNDPAMNDRRFRLRLMETASNDDVDITQVSIYKDTAQGSIPLYGLVFSDLASKGEELKVMLWTDVHHDHD